MPQTNPHIEYTILPQKRLNLGLGELWRYRELFFFFTWRDIKVKYKQTLLGFLWAILQPLMMMMVFVIFFSRLLNIPTDNLPPPIFYFSGLLFWNLFSSSLSGSANSMVSNADIIKKVYFPRLIIPISSVLVSFFDFLMAALIFCGIIIYYLFTDSFQIDFFWFVLSILGGLSLTLLTSIGLGTFLAALNVKYRDFRYVIPFMIQFLMFVSPVIYPSSILQETPWAKYLLAANPISGAIDLVRTGFTNQPLDMPSMFISVCCAIIIFVLGLFTFRSTERYFADLA